MLRIVLLAWISLAVPLVGAQQPAPASVRGVIVSAASNGPLTKANVEVRSIDGRAVIASIVTNSEGQFFLKNIRPGSYRLTVTRDGYIQSEYGQKHPGGPPQNLVLMPGQALTDVRMAMTKGGVISGHITDKGQPVGIADVVALKIRYVDGLPTLTEVLSAKTDDLGAYSIFWLPPGRYYVVTMVWDSAAQTFPVYVSPDGPDRGADYVQRRSVRTVLNRAIGAGAADNEAHVPIYFPGTLDPQVAAAIEIRPGSEVRNINIDASPVPIRHIRGRITGLPPGLTQRPGGILFPLGPRLSATDSIFINEGQADLSGVFDISRVSGGSYMLFAGTDDGKRIGRIPVTVRDQDLDVVVPLTDALTVNGRVTIERQADTPAPGPQMKDFAVIIRADSINEGDSVPVDADGSFELEDLPPWDYRILLSPLLTPAGQRPPYLPPALQSSYVKSIRIGEQDVLNGGLHIVDTPPGPIEIVIGTDAGTVEGRVVNDRQQAVGSIWVSLIPDSSLRYRVNHKFVSTDANGRFQLQGVPPGDYRIFAIEDAETGSWQDPGYMRDYESRGTAVHVNANSTVAIDVVSIPPRN
jgi:hypothetical protein